MATAKVPKPKVKRKARTDMTCPACEREAHVTVFTTDGQPTGQPFTIADRLHTSCARGESAVEELKMSLPEKARLKE